MPTAQPPIQHGTNEGYCRPFWERAAIKLFWNFSWKSRLFPRIKTGHKRKSGHIYHTRHNSRPHAALYPRPSEGLNFGVSSGVSWVRDSVLCRAEACKSDIAETTVNRASCATLHFGASRSGRIKSPLLCQLSYVPTGCLNILPQSSLLDIRRFRNRSGKAAVSDHYWGKLEYY